jgi:hydroxyethylthiazole kinase-like uncharacterized protein yjeF
MSKTERSKTDQLKPDRTNPTVVTAAVLRAWPLPEPAAGKESRGRTLIIGGSPTTPGAALLAAEAALRSGAGKLQVATVESCAPTLAVALPEAMVVGVAESKQGGIARTAAAQLVDLANSADAVLVGPGMTDPDETAALLAAMLPRLETPVVLDALAVTALRDTAVGTDSVLTPNLRELALVLQSDESNVTDDPGTAAYELARRTGATVTAGGEESWTVTPTGDTWRDPSGGVGLGVSGSGDVFAGVVSGLRARGAAPDQAAVWAAFLHGRAGDRLAATVGRVGFLARELPGEIPRVLSEIEV